MSGSISPLIRVTVTEVNDSGWFSCDQSGPHAVGTLRDGRIVRFSLDPEDWPSSKPIIGEVVRVPYLDLTCGEPLQTRDKRT